MKSVEDQIADFERRFDDLTFCLENELEKKVSLKRLRHSVTSLPITIRGEHYQFIKESIKDFKSAEDIEHIFMHLNLYWTYLEYSLLNHIVQYHSHMLSEELKENVRLYIEDIEVFKKHTKLKQVLEADHGHWCIRREPPPGFSRIYTRLDQATLEYTLAELDKLHYNICHEYNLSTFIFLLESVSEGSLQIMWHVPSSEVHSMMVNKSLQLIFGDSLVFIQVDMPTAYAGEKGFLCHPLLVLVANLVLVHVIYHRTLFKCSIYPRSTNLL